MPILKRLALNLKHQVKAARAPHSYLALRCAESRDPGFWRDALVNLPGLIAAIILAAPVSASAEFFHISDEDLCGAPGEEHEMQHTIRLTSHEMSNHFFGCHWPENLAALLAADGSAMITAECGNGTGNWQAEFEFAPQMDGSLAVFQRSDGISPVKFYDCNTGGGGE